MYQILKDEQSNLLLLHETHGLPWVEHSYWSLAKYQLTTWCCLNPWIVSRLHSKIPSYKNSRHLYLVLYNHRTSSQINVRFQHLFSMLVASGRDAGRTFFTTYLLKEGNLLTHSIPQRIIWCSSKHQPDLIEQLNMYSSNKTFALLII